MIESFWIVKVYAYPYRVTAETAAMLRKALEELRASKLRDTTIVPCLFPCQDIYNTPLFLDLKGISAMWLSTPDLRDAEEQHTKLLNKPTSFD